MGYRALGKGARTGSAVRRINCQRFPAAGIIPARRDPCSGWSAKPLPHSS